MNWRPIYLMRNSRTIFEQTIGAFIVVGIAFMFYVVVFGSLLFLGVSVSTSFVAAISFSVLIVVIGEFILYRRGSYGLRSMYHIETEMLMSRYSDPRERLDALYNWTIKSIDETDNDVIEIGERATKILVLAINNGDRVVEDEMRQMIADVPKLRQELRDMKSELTAAYEKRDQRRTIADSKKLLRQQQRLQEIRQNIGRRGAAV